jgi:hypothetical protein
MSSTYFTWPGRRVNDPGHDRVAAFLVMDIQRSPQWSVDLHAKIDEVKNGARASWERIGNAYRLRLSAAGAWIEDLVDQTSVPQCVSLEEFEAAVNAWTKAIARPLGSSAPPGFGDEGGQVAT